LIYRSAVQRPFIISMSNGVFQTVYFFFSNRFPSHRTRAYIVCSTARTRRKNAPVNGARTTGRNGEPARRLNFSESEAARVVSRSFAREKSPSSQEDSGESASVEVRKLCARGAVQKKKKSNER
jgi:hypothetical protein